MEKVVTGCNNCPLNNLIRSHYCEHPKSNNKYIPLEYLLDDENKPDWCPLKEEPITIKLKQ